MHGREVIAKRIDRENAIYFRIMIYERGGLLATYETYELQEPEAEKLKRNTPREWLRYLVRNRVKIIKDF